MTYKFLHAYGGRKGWACRLFVLIPKNKTGLSSDDTPSVGYYS